MTRATKAPADAARAQGAQDLHSRLEKAEAECERLKRVAQNRERSDNASREKLKALTAQRDRLMETCETFVRCASQPDLDHLPDELVISMSYDDTAYDKELGGPDTLLGEPFLRAFRALRSAYDAITEGGER